MRIRRSQRNPALRRTRAGARGFTLMEMMTVVLIITLVAGLAMPLIGRQLQDQKAREVAQRVAGLYRNAKLRAMGRGAAVMVRFDAGTDSRGRFRVDEARIGAAGAANPTMPLASCLLPNWDDAAQGQFRGVTQLDVGARGEFPDIFVTLAGGTSQLDICFTPMGRTFMRVGGAELTPMNQAQTGTVMRKLGTNPVGLARNLLILPNGAARLTLQ